MVYAFATGMLSPQPFTTHLKQPSQGALGVGVLVLCGLVVGLIGGAGLVGGGVTGGGVTGGDVGHGGGGVCDHPLPPPPPPDQELPPPPPDQELLPPPPDHELPPPKSALNKPKVCKRRPPVYPPE